MTAARIVLLLLPFLIVAASLGLSHAWRQSLMLVPEITARAPSVPVVAAPKAPLPPPVAVPTFEPPVRLAYPIPAPSLPALDIPAGRLAYPQSRRQSSSPHSICGRSQRCLCLPFQRRRWPIRSLLRGRPATGAANRCRALVAGTAGLA